MKSILVATDFSSHSQDVLREVLEQLREVPCRILPINTYLVDQSAGPENILALNDELKSQSKRKLEVQRAEALKENFNSHVSIETGSHMGSIDNVIKNLLLREKIDLIAMSNPSGTKLEKVEDFLKRQSCAAYPIVS